MGGRSIDPQVLKSVAQAFRDQMGRARITIDDLASAYVAVDASELERRLGRRVTAAELLDAKSCCRREMDRLIIGALDELHEALRAALKKIADDGAA
jgi:hypothetical protein